MSNENKALLKNFNLRFGLRDITPSGWVLLAFNICLGAALFVFNWQPLYLVCFYMAESVIIGAFNALKMVISIWQGVPIDPSTKGLKGWALVPFYLFHYNFFIVVQFMVFFGFVSFGLPGNTSALDYINSLFNNTEVLGIWALVITHLFSFISDYLLSGAYKKLGPDVLMMQPYSRIIIQQFVVIFGGIAGMFFGLLTVAVSGQNQAASVYAILLIVLKTYFDLASHTHVNTKNAARTAAV